MVFPLLLAAPFVHSIAAHLVHAAAHVAHAAAHAAGQGAHAAQGFIAAHGAHIITHQVATQVIEKLCEEAGISNEGFRSMIAAVSTGGISIGALFSGFCGVLESECPKRKDGHPDMRFKKSKMWAKIKKGEFGIEAAEMLKELQ
jgi:hypothetical protein